MTIHHQIWLMMGVLIGLAGALVVRLYRLHRRHTFDVKVDHAVRMLSTAWVVDEITMPDPTDPRWRVNTVSLLNGTTRDMICLNEIMVDPIGIVHVGCGIPPLPNGKEYATVVVREYRKRIATKAIQ